MHIPKNINTRLLRAALVFRPGGTEVFEFFVVQTAICKRAELVHSKYTS